MKNSKLPFFCQTTLAGSLLLAFGGACAQDANSLANEIRKDLYTPDSSVAVGVGYQSSDNRRFSQYRGLNEEDAYGLLDLKVIKRNDETGTWLKIKGKALGIQNRELRVDHERQGDWSYFLQGTHFSRNEPLQVNTALMGIGTGTQEVSATAPKRNVDLKVEHDIYALGVRKFIAGGFDVRISAKQDEKKGDRMFGRGFAAATSVMEFLTEPIDHVTRQWDVVASYANRKFQLTGGYSGSSYLNNIPVLNTTGGNSAPTAFGPSYLMAFPLSNNAHQLHLAGGYNWSDTSRSSFKLSRAVATQNETFDPRFTSIRSPDSLDGKVITTLAFADLTMRPMERLDIVGQVRYEDRDDQTPADEKYLAASSVGPNATGFYKPRQLKQLKGTLEAGYKLDGGYRLVGSLEQEDITRNRIGTTLGLAPVVKIGFPENVKETTERLEIKRTMSESLNGGLAYIHSNRSGSEYIRDTLTSVATATAPATNSTNQVAALLWADRNRDKLRLTVDWMPADAWSLQLLADVSEDSYSGRALGPRKGSAQFLSGDVTYRINDKWNLSSWLSKESTQTQQSTGIKNALNWAADLRDTTTAWGISLKGKPRSNLELGADLSSSLDLAESAMSKISGVTTTPVTSLPDYFYRQLSLKLFANYALDRQSGIRVDFVVDHRDNNDWTWQNWKYTDGTTVTNLPSEKAAFIGISYHYRWR